ncbi:hypothetical protein [Adhaeribacter soli]|uniref:hypothetical protein n=1 Tax=Adhaeribacter soli TaxID=2607655 RepID=UPI00177F6273|nr:hypothetical protein [Adhaeribacter soli]
MNFLQIRLYLTIYTFHLFGKAQAEVTDFTQGGEKSPFGGGRGRKGDLSDYFFKIM